MAQPSIPRVIRGRLWFQVSDVLFPRCPPVEMLLLQAQALLREADEANHGGHPVTYDLQRQARELVGAALDRCVGGAP